MAGNAERMTRYRQRQQLDATARALGWTTSPVEAVYVTPQGTTVALGIDGARIPLTLDPTFDTVGAPASTVGSISAVSTAESGQVEIAGVRPPDAWPRELAWPQSWNAAVKQAEGRSKAEWLDSLTTWIHKHAESTKLARQIVRQLTAMVNALPDTPDWHSTIPTLPVAETEG